MKKQKLRPRKVKQRIIPDFVRKLFFDEINISTHQFYGNQKVQQRYQWNRTRTFLFILSIAVLYLLLNK